MEADAIRTHVQLGTQTDSKRISQTCALDRSANESPQYIQKLENSIAKHVKQAIYNQQIGPLNGCYTL